MSRLLLLALLAAALAGTIAWELQPPAAPELGDAPRRAAAATKRAAPPLDAAAAAQGWMTTALERPLFRENRRPDKTAGDIAMKADAPMRLAGVITGPAGNNAIFMAAGDAKPLVVSEGMQVGDFIIRSIEPGRVIVEADGALRTLTPEFAPNGQAARKGN